MPSVTVTPRLSLTLIGRLAPAVALAGLIAILVLFPQSGTRFDPTLPNLASRFAPPSWSLTVGHTLGADQLGRDLLSRSLVAGKYTLLISGAATVIALIASVVAGFLAGYFQGWIDTALMRLVDALMSLPLLLVAIVMIAVLGRSVVLLVVLLAVTGWATMTRLFRSAVLSVRSEPYVESAVALGARHTGVIARHVLPNALSVVLVTGTYYFARFILLESAISYLGLGVNPPMTTWGGMLSGSQTYLYEQPLVSIVPGTCIAFTVYLLNVTGDSLSRLANPRLGSARRREARGASFAGQSG